METQRVGDSEPRVAANVTSCNKVFIRSKLLCTGEKNQDKKLESNPIQFRVHFGVGAGQTKTDIHIAYMLNFRRSIYVQKAKKINFLMESVSYQNSFRVNANHQNK
jgi:hypothetical protein